MKEISAETASAYMADVQRLGASSIGIYLDLATLLTVISQLQLALRHPENVGPASHICRQLVDGLIERAALTEPIRAVLEAGNDTDYDRPPRRRPLKIDNPN